MNSNWRNRPTPIEYVPKKISWIFGIDESGNPNLKNTLKSLKKSSLVAQSEKHFVVTGCLMRTSDLDLAKDKIMHIKNSHWKNGFHDYKGVTKRVCFHSREIRGQKDPFSPNLIDYNKFMRELSSCLENLPLDIYSSYIDKEKHVTQYATPHHPYELCLTFLLERIMMKVPFNEDCIIVIEARGKKEDRTILNHIKKIIDEGTQYKSKNYFSRIKGVYFNPKWSRVSSDKKSYWILELADLYSYPIYKYFTHNKKDSAFNVLEKKINGYPDINGKGLKRFP